MKTKGIFVIWYGQIFFLIHNLTDPSTIDTLSKQDIIEGGALSVTCHVTPGNPSYTTVYWTKVENSGFRQNGATLRLLNMQRNSSGTRKQLQQWREGNSQSISGRQRFVSVSFITVLVS